MSLDYHTDDFEQFLRLKEDKDIVANLDRSLPLYLSGKIDYNKTLREWLQDE